MGCLVALQCAIDNPGLVPRLILVGPPPTPLLEAGSKASHARAALVRARGMAAVVDAVSTAGTSQKTKESDPVALTAVRLSLLGTPAEGYAKACTALANATTALDCQSIKSKVLMITGTEDKVCPPGVCEKYQQTISGETQTRVLDNNVGHWHVFEDASGVAKAIDAFL